MGGGGGLVVEVVFSKRKFKFLGKMDEKNWIFFEREEYLNKILIEY